MKVKCLICNVITKQDNSLKKQMVNPIKRHIPPGKFGLESLWILSA